MAPFEIILACFDDSLLCHLLPGVCVARARRAAATARPSLAQNVLVVGLAVLVAWLSIYPVVNKFSQLTAGFEFGRATANSGSQSPDGRAGSREGHRNHQLYFRNSHRSSVRTRLISRQVTSGKWKLKFSREI